MIKKDFKQFLPHLISIAVFWVLAAVYVFPVFQGKKLEQSDIRQWKGSAKEIMDYREKTGKEALWTNSMFAGMPAYQIDIGYPANMMYWFDRGIRQLLPVPADMIFLYMIGFYILLICLGLDSRLSIVGAIAYAFCSYNLSIIETGHNTKAIAIGYMPLVLAGVLRTYQGKFFSGGALAALALALELFANHLQITYYLGLIIMVLVIFQFVSAIREKSLVPFFKATAVLGIAALLALGTNITNIWTTYEYGKATTRGQSELSEKKSSSGLDKDYALGWSYGKAETFTLLIPNFVGGSSTGELSTGSESYKTLIDKGISPGQAQGITKNAPLYWGEQPFTSGPVYIGAIICFLFVLGLFVVKGPVKWWLLTASLLSIVLAWGKNFPPVTDLFFDYFPAYNKFRAVSVTLVIAGLTMPLLGLIALKNIFEGKEPVAVLKKNILYSLYIVGGFCLFFVLLPGLFFDFKSSADEQMLASGYPDWLVNAIRVDRESLLRMDALRSLFFILLAASALFLFELKKIKKEYAILAISLLTLCDLWTVGRRYFNNDSFVSESRQKSDFVPTSADAMILQDKDPNYRVLNTAVNTFNDATTSYYHKSIGGYHGAKLKRYQELIENQISKNNPSVLDMLNTKYIIGRDEKSKELRVNQNPGAMGNAWFVKEFKLVANADSEMNALSDFNPGQTAIVDKRYEQELGGLKIAPDSSAKIVLTSYSPNDLVYQSKSSSEQLCVFSEIYYEKGWNAYVDGKLSPHFRADYVLRSMRIPAGEHKVEFKFEPEAYFTGEKISLASSLVLILLIIGAVYSEMRKPKTA